MLVTSAEVVALPALSVAVARRSYFPSASVVVFQAAGVKTQLVVVVGAYSYVTVASPEPPVSLALDVIVTVPARIAFDAGLVMETVGGVASTVHVRETDALVLA
jgi:hypothetical protein